jgi:hypothetical protein
MPINNRAFIGWVYTRSYIPTKLIGDIYTDKTNLKNNGGWLVIHIDKLICDIYTDKTKDQGRHGVCNPRVFFLEYAWELRMYIYLYINGGSRCCELSNSSICYVLDGGTCPPEFKSWFVDPNFHIFFKFISKFNRWRVHRQ